MNPPSAFGYVRDPDFIIPVCPLCGRRRTCRLMPCQRCSRRLPVAWRLCCVATRVRIIAYVRARAACSVRAAHAHHAHAAHAGCLSAACPVLRLLILEHICVTCCVC